MLTMPHILAEFEEKKSKGKITSKIVGFTFLFNLLSNCILYYCFNPDRTKAFSLENNGVNFLREMFYILPMIMCYLFLRNKKCGWYFLTVWSILLSVILLKFFITQFLEYDNFRQFVIILFSKATFDALLYTTLSFLLFTKNIRQYFNVSKQNFINSILVAAILIIFFIGIELLIG